MLKHNEIAHVLESAYTTRQLIESLLSLDPGHDEKGGDNRVLFVCNYGDHHNTQQALPVGELDTFSTDDLHESGYSHSNIAMNDEDRDDGCGEDDPVEADEEAEDVIILR